MMVTEQEQHQTNGHVPGLAELTIDQVLSKPAKPKKFGLGWFGKLKPKPKPDKTTPTKPANKTKQQTSKLQTVNKTSKVQIEFESLIKLETGLQWIENLIHILTPRLLVVGFVLSMVDLLTRGSFVQNPYTLYVWAVVQALAVEATLPNLWRLAFIRFDEKRYLPGSILLVLGIGLGLVVFAAFAIQILQQTLNISLPDAMGRLWLNPELFTYIRASSVVSLAVVLSVLNRTKTTTYRTQNQTQNQIEIKPANQTDQADQTSQQNQVPEKEQNTDQLPAIQNKPLRLISSVDGQTPNKKQTVLSLLQQNPNLGVLEIVNQTGITKGYVSSVRSEFLANN